jgi:ribosomal protein L12E/L44/L45/RPP1/RPP2
MEDLRNNDTNPLKGSFVTAGYSVEEEKVKEMLTFMGVDPDEEIIADAIGYLSSNSMEIDMNNLHQFLQTKQIMSSKHTNKVHDFRKKNK